MVETGNMEIDLEDIDLVMMAQLGRLLISVAGN